MKFKSDIEPVGLLDIKVYAPDGSLKTDIQVPNLVVTTGKQFIAGRMVGTPTTMSHMAIGTGTTAPAVGQTALIIQTGRVALGSATNAAATVTFTANFPAGTGTGAITEAGIFDGASGGNMLSRTTFGVITKAAEDIMAISWTITVL